LIFNMFCICFDVKVTLNIRIVVIGASEVGISLLETLAFWFVTVDMIMKLCSEHSFGFGLTN